MDFNVIDFFSIRLLLCELKIFLVCVCDFKIMNLRVKDIFIMCVI